MTRKIASLFVAALLLAIPAFSQVQLGGHIYVPSTGDSTNGLTRVNFLGATVCNLLTPVTCQIYNSQGFAPGPDAPWVGTISINDLSFTTQTLEIPWTPGRFYVITNQTGGSNLYVVGYYNGAEVGSSINIPADSTVLLWAKGDASGSPGYQQIGGGIVNGTPNIALTFPQESTFNVGPAYNDSFWNNLPPGTAGCTAFIGNGANTYGGAANPLYGPFYAGWCDSVESQWPVTGVLQNTSNSNTAQAIFNVTNNDYTDGGWDNYAVMGISGTNFEGGYGMYGHLADASMSFFGAAGGPLMFYSIKGPNNIDPIIHFSYNNSSSKPNDDAHIDSSGFHIDRPGTPTCTTSGIYTSCYSALGSGGYHEWGSIAMTANSSTYDTATATLPIAGTSTSTTVWQQPTIVGTFSTDTTTPPCVGYTSTSTTTGNIYMARCIVASAGGGFFDQNFTVNWSADVY